MTEDDQARRFTEVQDFADELMRLSPEVEAALTAHGDDLGPDPEFPGVWMSSAGRAVSRALAGMSDTTRTAVFALVEHHLATGTQSMRDAVATELLEALANEVSGGHLHGPTLATLLGPESRAYVDAWDQFTLGRSSLTDDYRPGTPD